MDMSISGAGRIAPGEYENIHISGSGKLSGLVRCASLHASGAAHGEELDCKNELAASGSCSFDRDIRCGSLRASGSFRCGGNATVREKLRCSGSARISGNIRCGELKVSGSLSAENDIEAEAVNVSGSLNCKGLLNAEEIYICTWEGMEIGSVGGSNVVMCLDKNKKTAKRLPLLASLIPSFSGCIRILGAIEADTVALENVKAPRVSGRVVAIGEDCEIELVQYSEQIEISPRAKVGRTEKL